MPFNIKLQTARRNAMVDGIATDVGNAGLLKIYDGTQPATIATAIGAQVLLAQLTCGTPFAAAASGGVLTANAITQDASADATGTASWYSLQTSAGVRVVEGSVGTSGSDLNLNTVSIVAGGPVAVTSFTYTAPGA
jgi:hypothetical protein